MRKKYLHAFNIYPSLISNSKWISYLLTHLSEQNIMKCTIQIIKMTQ